MKETVEVPAGGAGGGTEDGASSSEIARCAEEAGWIDVPEDSADVG